MALGRRRNSGTKQLYFLIGVKGSTRPLLPHRLDDVVGLIKHDKGAFAMSRPAIEARVYAVEGDI